MAGHLAPATADRHCRARPRPARRGFADPSFEYPQANARDVDHLHETHIHAGEKQRVLLQKGAERRHRCRIDIGHFEHRVGITHRDGTEAPRLTLKFQCVVASLGIDLERHIARRETRDPHVDTYLVCRR